MQIWTPLPFTNRIANPSNVYRITGYSEHSRYGRDAKFSPDLLFGLERPTGTSRSGNLRIKINQWELWTCNLCARSETESGLYLSVSYHQHEALELDIFGAIMLCKYLSATGNVGEHRNNEITLGLAEDYGRFDAFSARFERPGAGYDLGPFPFRT